MYMLPHTILPQDVARFAFLRRDGAACNPCAQDTTQTVLSLPCQQPEVLALQGSPALPAGALLRRLSPCIPGLRFAHRAQISRTPCCRQHPESPAYRPSQGSGTSSGFIQLQAKATGLPESCCSSLLDTDALLSLLQVRVPWRLCG